MKSIKIEINWTTSPSHIMLLCSFKRPSSITSVLEWHRLSVRGLGESVKSAIDRFITDGALEEARPEEKIAHTFKLDQLKRLLEKYERPSGTKIELATKLCKYNCNELSKAFSSSLMKCSESGLDIINNFNRLKDDACSEAKKMSYKALCDGDYKLAFDISRQYAIKFHDEPCYVSIQSISNIFKAEPKFLSKLSRDDVIALKVSLAMTNLWHNEGQLDWLCSTISISAHEFKKLSERLQRKTSTSTFRIVDEWCDIDVEIDEKPLIINTDNSSQADIETRLNNIKDLFEKGLIDSYEYTETRKRILQCL